MKIPQELFENIIECIESRDTLATLALANSSVNIDAERVLYRKMTEHDLELHAGFLEAVEKSRRRGGYVRVFHSYELVFHRMPAMKLHFGPSYYQMLLVDMQRHLLGALVNMVNLKFFSLNVERINSRADFHWGSSSSEGLSINTLLEKMILCTFQLEAFHCVGHLDYQLLSQFLLHQRQLRRLSHTSNRKTGLDTWPNDVKTVARPILYFLRGSKNMLDAFLPAGNVEMLIWETTTWETFEGFVHEGAAQVKRFAPSLSTVKYLSFEVDNTFFSLLPPYLHNLQCLQLAKFQRNTECSPHHLNRIRSLRVVMIPHSLSDTSSLPNAPYTVQDILSSCPHIRYVGDFTYEDGTYHYNILDSFHQKALSYWIPKSFLQHRHIFEILSFPDPLCFSQSQTRIKMRAQK